MRKCQRCRENDVVVSILSQESGLHLCAACFRAMAPVRLDDTLARFEREREVHRQYEAEKLQSWFDVPDAAVNR